MTDASELTANPQFHGHARERNATEAVPSDVRSRLFEVAIWAWRIAAVGLVIWVMAAALVLYVEYGRQGDVLGIFGLYAAATIIFTLIVWTVRYVVSGVKSSFTNLLKRTAFGNLPLYVWFVPSVLYFGGLLTALWYDASNDALRLQHFAEGVGSALAALMLGAAGGVFAPKKWMYQGHMIGTVIVIVAILAARFYIQ